MIYGTPTIVTSGLVLQLDAANRNSYPTTGTTWTDLSGRNNNGTLISTNYGNNFGGNISFSGTLTSYSTITNNGSLTFGSGDFSVECWFNTNGVSQTTNAGLVVIGNVGDTTNWQLSFTTNQLVFFYNSINSISTSYFATTSGWTQVLLTRVGGTAIIYINGVRNVSGAASSNFSDTSGLKLARNRGGNAPYNGAISIVRAYNIGLSALQVQQNYNALKTRFGLF
jgi:hypothetical protein